MPQLPIIRDRYDGQQILPFINSADIRFGSKQPYIEAPWGDDEEFAIYFDTADGSVDEDLLDSARSLMSRIGQLDNSVQESCAAACESSGLHPRNFEGMLAYVTISRQGARLRYFGTGVNTEWDELAGVRNGVWEHMGTATPDLSARRT